MTADLARGDVASPEIASIEVGPAGAGPAGAAPVGIAPGSERPAGYAWTMLEINGALRDRVTALLGVEVGAIGPVSLAVAPHESLVFAVNLARGDSPLERKCASGLHASLTGIRRTTGRYQTDGDCITLLALLTPLGVVELLESRTLADAPRIKAPLAGLLDRQVALALERELAVPPTLPGKLERLAGWLEARATRPRCQSPAAVRTARVATRICRDAPVDVETLARDELVSRRQLERDFQRWIGTSPRHLSQVARLQAVSRRARRGSTLAAVAADAGFADQAHMSRVVRSLTGMTPGRFVRSRQSPIADAFRIATGGATVYL